MADRWLSESSRGFSLTEVLIALALGLLSVAAVLHIYLTYTRFTVVQDDYVELTQTVRAALDMMAREVRIAGYDPRGVNRDDDPSNDFPGLVVDPERLLIQADLNGNGAIADANEQIVYLWDPDTQTLRRDTGGGHQPVADHIQSFTFEYLDTQGAPAASSADIAAVVLALEGRTAHPDPHLAPQTVYGTLRLSSVISPPNLLVGH